MTTDFEGGFHEVELDDGRLVREPFSQRMARRPVTIQRHSFDPSTGLLSLVLPAGDPVELEIGTSSTEGDLAGRPVIYLDQNHWITLARVLWAPAKVKSAAVLEAGLRLIAVARERAVVLPLSGGHLAEAPPNGAQRRHLVTTMLQLSHGWQLRSPLEIRRQELGAAMAGGAPVARGVVTLEPWAMFSQSIEPPDTAPDFPPQLVDIHRRLTAASTACDAALDDDSEPNRRARELAFSWGQLHQRLGEYMGDRNTPREHARLNARAVLISDMQRDLANAAAYAGLTAPSFEAWLERELETALPQMPALGRVHELIYRRLRNPQKKWRRNDLNDVHYLASAAGYADLVVAENETGHDLSQVAKQVRGGATVVRSLPAAIDELRELTKQRFADAWVQAAAS